MPVLITLRTANYHLGIVTNQLLFSFFKQITWALHYFALPVTMNYFKIYIYIYIYIYVMLVHIWETVKENKDSVTRGKELI
jgi:hypothetical protein